MHVLVVGAGPSGLLLALLLGNAGIDVTIVEAAGDVDPRPRASMYGPAAIAELRRAGILDEVRRQGIICGDICWRKLDGTMIQTFNDSAQKSTPNALTSLPLYDLGNVMLRDVLKLENIKVLWNHPVKQVGQDANSAWVVTEPEGGEKKIVADYVCGCDGANSIVRKSLFGDSFPGKTWPEQTVATNMYYDFHKHGFNDINFIIHPTHYYMAALMTQDGMWRVTYGESNDMTHDEIRANQPKKYAIMLPGQPQPGDYKLVSVSPYRLHQRCAEKFRVGRVLLAADAAHLCSPWGGLGLTGGIIDVGGLFDCLNGIFTGQADEDILDKYSEHRKRIWQEVTDPVSSANFRRVSAADPETAGEVDEFLQLVKKANADPETKKIVDQMAYGLCHDFTQYYHGGKNGVESTTHGAN